jgi:TorA maturation chaperone TorD
MTEASPVRFVPTLPPEEVARANFYGLLARLFYAPPDATLLQALGNTDEVEAEGEGDDFARAWQALSAAARQADAEAVREEYDRTFVGTGRAPVTPYTCAYTIKLSNEVPLARLRAELAGLGLGRKEGVHEPEDHIAALCDVMRHLIAEQKRDLEDQRAFFETWIWPAVQPLCNAIEKSETTDFYKRVSAVLYALCTIEHTAFEML